MGKLPSFEWSACTYSSSPGCRCGDKIQSKNSIVECARITLLREDKAGLNI